MNVRVETTQFEASHGRKPRGTGTWFFFFGKNDDVMDAFQVHGSFTDAKKAAMAEASRRNETVVHVGS